MHSGTRQFSNKVEVLHKAQRLRVKSVNNNSYLHHHAPELGREILSTTSRQLPLGLLNAMHGMRIFSPWTTCTTSPKLLHYITWP